MSEKQPEPPFYADGNRGDAEYWQALGHFIEAFSTAEGFLFHLLELNAKVSNSVAKAVFSGMRTEILMQSIKRIWENNEPDTETKNELDDIFKQLRAINKVRNIIIHNVSKFDTNQGRTVSDLSRALTPERTRTERVSPEILADLTADLLKIAAHFATYLLMPDGAPIPAVFNQSDYRSGSKRRMAI